MNQLNEFAASSNGDRWFLGRAPGNQQAFVLHRGNAPSGGHETRMPVDAFLAQKPFGPERDALLAVLDGTAEASPRAGTDEKTPSLKLAERYLELGGCRRAKVDDNIVSTRKWEDEPAEATAFWEEHVAPMDEKQRQEVEIHLPSISDQ